MSRRKVQLAGISLLLLLGGLLGGVLGSIKPATAMSGGDDDTEMTKSVARITYLGQELCTGSVVSDGWVLTALHCNFSNGKPLNWHMIYVQLWQAGRNISSGYESSLSEPPLPMSDGDSGNALNRDVMLLHVATPMPGWAKTIPMALRLWPAVGTALTEYGYGNTSGAKNASPSTNLKKSHQGNITRADCPTHSGYLWTSGHICITSSGSYPWPGDSGGPLLWWNNGYWQQVGSFSLYPRQTDPDQNWRSYWSELDGDTRNWILSTVGANFAFGTILRDVASGVSWLYEADGYRHWIPDEGTYNCLVHNGATVLNRPLRTVEALPDMVGSWAPCTLPPPPPKTWAETAGGVAHTWTNYQNAGGTQGPSVAQYQTIQIACKLTGFKVSDGNIWWYRIAQTPWNNQYYVSADAFYNNGATSGPLKGTPFVDPAVANC